jgi:hypothetical protein
VSTDMAVHIFICPKSHHFGVQYAFPDIARAFQSVVSATAVIIQRLGLLLSVGSTHAKIKVSIYMVGGFLRLFTFPSRGFIQEARDMQVQYPCAVVSQRCCYHSTIVPVMVRHLFMQWSTSLSMFRRNVSPPSSGSKNNPRKQSVSSRYVSWHNLRIHRLRQYTAPKYR